MSACRPTASYSRARGYQRPVGQVHRIGRLADVVDHGDPRRRIDGEPIDHHAVVCGPARLVVHEFVVVNDVRGSRVTGAGGDESKLVAGVEPRRVLEHDVRLSTATPADPEPGQRRGHRDRKPSLPGSTSRDSCTRGMPYLTRHLHPLFMQINAKAVILELCCILSSAVLYSTLSSDHPESAGAAQHPDRPNNIALSRPLSGKLVPSIKIGSLREVKPRIMSAYSASLRRRRVSLDAMH